MKGEPFRILLVEDNSSDVYLLEKALASASLAFEVTVIGDGGTALDFLQGNSNPAGSAIPDLAIIDLSLPKNDGIQVLEAIRAMERFVGMPVIVMSSAASPPARLNLEHLQVARYIKKPPDLDEFLRTGEIIRDLLESRAGSSGH